MSLIQMSERFRKKGEEKEWRVLLWPTVPASLGERERRGVFLPSFSLLPAMSFEMLLKAVQLEGEKGEDQVSSCYHTKHNG